MSLKKETIDEIKRKVETMVKLKEIWVVIETSVSNYSLDINDLKKMFLAEKDSYRPDSVFEVESKKYDKNKLSETRLFLEFNNDQPDDVILGYEGETEKVYYLLNKIKLDAITNRIIDVCTK